MNAFIIPEFEAEILSVSQIITHLDNIDPFIRRVNSNLEAYSPEDIDNKKDKILTFMDGDIREGFLNFYFLHFSNDIGILFVFGEILGKKIQKTFFLGKAQGQYENKRVLLNDLINKTAIDFNISYKTKNYIDINTLIDRIVANLRF